MCFPVGSGTPHVLSQDIGLSDLWYYWLGPGLGVLNGRQVGPGWDLFSASSFKLIHSFFLFAKWAPLMEEIFGSQVAFLAQM